MIAQRRGAEVRPQGPRAFQRRRLAGGRRFAQARAQRLERQEPDVRLRGRLSRPHARRVGDHLVLPLPPPLRPFRRARAVHPVPVSLPRPQGHEQGRIRPCTACSSSQRLFESEYNGVWDPKAGQAEYAAFYVEPIQGTGGYVDPAEELLHRAQEGARPATASCSSSTKSRWASSAPASCGRSSISASQPDVLVFGKALTNGLNPLSGIWAREELINPGRSSRPARRTRPSRPTRSAPPSASKP